MFETLWQHPLLVLNQAVRDPIDTLAARQDSFHSRIESTNKISYIADPGWEATRHRRGGIIRVRGGGFSAVVVYRRGDPSSAGHGGWPFQLLRMERRGCGTHPGHLVADPPLATR
jgi:hypothetical protein